jgi:hypothetical protein
LWKIGVTWQDGLIVLLSTQGVFYRGLSAALRERPKGEAEGVSDRLVALLGSKVWKADCDAQERPVKIAGFP